MKSLIRMICLAVLLTTTSQVQASMIAFTYTGIGAGSIGGTDFSSRAFTITALGDTNARQSITGGYSIDHISASISIVGTGEYTFTTETRTFYNDLGDIAGFSRAGISGIDLYVGPFNAGLSGWDMLTSVGPISGSSQITSEWSSPIVNTSGGQLIFNESINSGTFQAVVGTATVPEPTSIALWGIGALGICLVPRHRKRLTA